MAQEAPTFPAPMMLILARRMVWVSRLVVGEFGEFRIVKPQAAEVQELEAGGKIS